MHKCKNCGNDFEGKFCPECGTKYCEEVDESPAQAVSEPKKQKGSPALGKLYTLLPHLPTALFALYTLLTFLFYIAPVMSFMGLGSGNLYATAADGDGTSVALIVFSVFSLPLAVLALLFQYCLPLQDKSGKLGRKSYPVYRLLVWVEYLFFFLFFLLGCILAGLAGTLISSAGPAPICVLVFALIFALVSGGAELGGFLIRKKCPEVIENLRAGLEEPTAPAPVAKPQKPEKPQYRTVVPPSEEGRREIEKHVKFKRTVLFLNFLPFLGVIGGVIGIVIGRIVGVKKWRPDKTYKLGWLIFAIIFSICMLLGAAALSYSSLSMYFYNLGNADYADSVKMDLILTICLLPYAVYSFIMMILDAIAISRGKKLAKKLYGAISPKKVPELVKQYKQDTEDYRTALPVYESEMETYKAYRKEYALYKKNYRRYFNGTAY